ncbi:MAG: HD domain-containing protein [Candidatus Accumulibacter sp.]|jgi:HPt (histidine-containing phosphotransfer) domain-containing protein|nr:HD domain-containing protein [Accumulibacter sp.]
MDIESILAPKIVDFEALEEFVEVLHDTTPVIERDMSRLKRNPNDGKIIGDLFRALHNIKGDAALCRIELAVTIAHPLETLLARLRSKEITFGEVLSETILLSIDRLELAMENLHSHRSLENLRLPVLIQGLEKLAATPADNIETAASDLIEAVTDFRPIAQSTAKFATVPAESPVPAADSAPVASPQTRDTLLFFRSLAEQIESRLAPFKGRTQRLLRLAIETNRLRDRIVDPIQLEAAIYMHDVGMMFLPEKVWLKAGKMTLGERAALRNHTGYAAGLLSRMAGWETAAEIVAQHHEMLDGKGYPRGMTAQTICDGAKIMAIVDAFESIILKHASHGKNRSLLRAIAEINACENQFAPEWIKPFNQVIRRTIDHS